METYFRTKFCVSVVQEGVLIKYFQLIVKICSKFCSGRTVSPALLLLLSRTCLDLHTNTTGHLASIMADQYQLLEVANMTQVNTSLASVSQSLLDTYVKVQAADLSLMIRKSVETVHQSPSSRMASVIFLSICFSDLIPNFLTTVSTFWHL